MYCSFSLCFFQSDDEKERRGHDNYKKFVADRKKQRLKEQYIIYPQTKSVYSYIEKLMKRSSRKWRVKRRWKSRRKRRDKTNLNHKNHNSCLKKTNPNSRAALSK